MDMLAYALAALSPINLGLALVGVTSGIIIGALPGLSATMAVAVLVPVTFGMAPESALIMLGAIYTGAIYGGSYSAILVNTPGTPSAIATTFDGFPMAKRGDGDLAVTLSTLASVAGGLVGVLALLTLAPLLAQVALSFGPVEYFWLAVFGLTLISALSEGSTLKGFMGAGLGLLLSTVGVAVVGGDIRYTFGTPVLLGGIETVSALIGLYCIPVLIDLVATPEAHLKLGEQQRGIRLREGMSHVLSGKFNLLRSATIGTGVAILPGAGGSIASLGRILRSKACGSRQRVFRQGQSPGGIGYRVRQQRHRRRRFYPDTGTGYPRHSAGCSDPGGVAGTRISHRARIIHDQCQHHLHLCCRTLPGHLLALAARVVDRALRFQVDHHYSQGTIGAHYRLHDGDRHICHSQ